MPSQLGTVQPQSDFRPALAGDTLIVDHDSLTVVVMSNYFYYFVLLLSQY